MNEIEKKIERVFTGKVVSDKMVKTVVAQVDYTKRHKKYKTQFRVSRKYKVHDEKEEAKEGDLIEFVETRPLSRHKRWRLIRVIKQLNVK